MSAAGAAAAAAASAAAKQRADQEEEEMTPYSADDLAQNWQFKILRSAAGKFRDPVWLHAVLAEEGRAGWTLVEKFDDARLRLKRPASAKARDAALGFDPLRTWVGISPTRLTLLILAGVFAGVGLLAALMVTLALKFG
jgi:hypothetical protein